jgi:energy-coupling factor transporter ATP-binding protein EcfA2
MKRIDVRRECEDFNGYMAQRVKSMFNVESGHTFSISADLPDADDAWSLGVIVGPSGSGKTTLGKELFGGVGLTDLADGWPGDKPIIECIPGSFDDATNALAAVGLGNVPSWLRPYSVLSGGEKFRAGLARVVCQRPRLAVIDEFTSVIDRQVAKFGALAFQKSWRRGNTGEKVVLLSCHYDVLEWLEPCWVFDTATGKLARDCLQRPRYGLDICNVPVSAWDYFAPHHYLNSGRLPMSSAYVGFVDSVPVCHVAVSSSVAGKHVYARACRLVVLPEWQGAGIGIRFLSAVCQMYLEGRGHLKYPARTVIHTTHPALCAGLRRAKGWVQVSAALHGVNKRKSAASIMSTGKLNTPTGYGGHFRAVQGFRYDGV